MLANSDALFESNTQVGNIQECTKHKVDDLECYVTALIW